MTAATATKNTTRERHEANHEANDVLAQFGITDADFDTFARIEADAELDGLVDTRVVIPADYVRIALEVAAEDAELHA